MKNFCFILFVDYDNHSKGYTINMKELSSPESKLKADDLNEVLEKVLNYVAKEIGVKAKCKVILEESKDNE